MAEDDKSGHKSPREPPAITKKGSGSDAEPSTSTKSPLPSSGATSDAGSGSRLSSKTSTFLGGEEDEEDKDQARMCKLFKLPAGEVLVAECNCAIDRPILLHGKMYVTQNRLCFHSNVFGVRNTIVIPYTQVNALRRASHAYVNPGISVATPQESLLFASFFGLRDHTFRILRACWKTARRMDPDNCVSLVSTKLADSAGGLDEDVLVPQRSTSESRSTPEQLLSLLREDTRGGEALAAEGRVRLKHELLALSLPCAVGEGAAALLLGKARPPTAAAAALMPL
jgi:hypothetical protein